MPLLNFPSTWISRFTSAALVVLYFSVAPLTGSKVLRVSFARGARGAALVAGVDSSVCFMRGRLMEYFVVMRVYRVSLDQLFVGSVEGGG